MSRRVVTISASNYLRVGAEVFPFDDTDSRAVDAALQWARALSPCDPARSRGWVPAKARVYAWRAWVGMPLWVRTIAASR